ncbi:MAG: hypothetical protein LUQ04_07475 [Methanoregula sp.]|nr:hypothetical protein [Methanoregula sp.]
MKRFIIAVLILLVLLQGTGFVTAAEPADYSKIIIMHLTINESGISEKSVEMRYGHAPNIESRSGDLRGTIKSSDGSAIREFDMWDPRYQLGDFLENDNNSSAYLSGYLVSSDTAEMTLILPYYENQMTFEVRDKETGILLKEVNMSQAITNFQTTYPEDPGGGLVPHLRIDGPTIYLITGIVLSILIMGMIITMIRKK